MNAEDALKKVLCLGTQMTDEQRQRFFELLCGVSIAFIRGERGEEVLNGFIYAAMKDNITMSYQELKATIN